MLELLKEIAPGVSRAVVLQFAAIQTGIQVGFRSGRAHQPRGFRDLRGQEIPRRRGLGTSAKNLNLGYVSQIALALGKRRCERTTTLLGYARKAWECAMFNFKNVSALSKVLRAGYKDGEPARAAMARILETDFKFPQEAAKLYASTVLSRNVERSADSMIANADKVIGTWFTSTQSGGLGGWLKTMLETWEFDSNLEFEHKRQTDESYINPLGGGFSRPTSWSERGLWAPSDSEPGKKLYLVVVGYSDGIARPLQLIWPDDSKDPDQFSIGGTVYARQ
jgi:hypothetical protein